MTNTFIFEFQYLFWKEAEKKSILEFNALWYTNK